MLDADLLAPSRARARGSRFSALGGIERRGRPWVVTVTLFAGFQGLARLRASGAFASIFERRMTTAPLDLPSGPSHSCLVTLLRALANAFALAPE